MTDILLTNDDGYSSMGFYPLLKELSQKYSVCTVVPNTQKSWVGKSITGHSDLELKESSLEEIKISTLTGTPADCVQVGLYQVLTERPKLVVSGINIGENVGHGRILSSGTVGAAMEAAIDGVRSISSSLYIPQNERTHIDFFDKKNYFIYKNAAEITLKIVNIIMDSHLDSGIDLLSINIPFKSTVNSKFEITKPFKEPYGQLFYKNGENLKLKNPILKFENLVKGTDLNALYNGKISITPISLELASKGEMKNLYQKLSEKW